MIAYYKSHTTIGDKTHRSIFFICIEVRKRAISYNYVPVVSGNIVVF